MFLCIRHVTFKTAVEEVVVRFHYQQNGTSKTICNSCFDYFVLYLSHNDTISELFAKKLPNHSDLHGEAYEGVHICKSQLVSTDAKPALKRSGILFKNNRTAFITFEYEK